ncbi:hypothetical protein SISSUDRAFT_836646 [Sistotremastrum suecicum HHB10207 ss-3]|uniref:Uncharacterized protein n=1 Tax=Sistotremastrum suecicum HHB10207 ss-3 TaxID=1314776 RepID=A0A166CL05_9AGAM|nr:hypothetical protein SISSUDRAFT_836646 [Sistotremastrum suecicum HHB10207 ss-3]
MTSLKLLAKDILSPSLGSWVLGLGLPECTNKAKQAPSTASTTTVSTRFCLSTSIMLQISSINSVISACWTHLWIV